MSTEVAKRDAGEQVIEYTAFGSDQKVKLTIRLIQNTIAVKTKSGVTPTLADCYKFAMLCKARALNPFEGDAFLVGYDCKDGAKFNLITAHQAFLKRAEVNPDYDGMESGIVVKDGDGKTIEKQGDFKEQGENLIGGWARVHFKNKKVPMFKKINLERFRKPFGVWNENPEGMIVKCAEADCLRSSFPTKMGGLYLKEEVERIEDGKATGRTVMEDNAVDVMPLDEPEQSRSEQLAAKLKPQPEQVFKPELVDGGNGSPESTPNTPESTGDNVVKGILEKVLIKTGIGKDKNGTGYSLIINNERYGTFSDTLGNEAQGLKGEHVLLEWELDKSGKYKNATYIALCRETAPNDAPVDDDPLSID
jgi:phage recombination protein Bet